MKHLRFLPIALLLAVSFVATKNASASGPASIDAGDPAIVAIVPAGKGARGPAIDPETGDIYVANWLEGTVSVFNTEGLEIKRVPTPSRMETWGPEAIAVDPTTHRVLVVDTTGDISVIDSKTNQVSKRIGLEAGGGWPMSASIVVDESERVILSSLRMDVKRLAALNADTLDVLSTFPALNDPHPMGFDSVSHLAYIPETVDSKIAVIDTRTASITDSIDLPTSPLAAGVDSLTHRVYVLAEPGQFETQGGVLAMYIIDGSSLHLVNTVDATSRSNLVWVSPVIDSASHRLYEVGDNELVTMDTNTDSIIASRQLLSGLTGVALDVARHRLYVTADPARDNDNPDDRVLIILDTTKLDASPAPAQLPNTGGPPGSRGGAEEWLPPGGLLAVLGCFLMWGSFRRRKEQLL